MLQTFNKNFVFVQLNLFPELSEGSGSFSPKFLNIAEWMIFFYIGCCLSGLGIANKNRRIPTLVL
jgi:hypothetical protein